MIDYTRRRSVAKAQQKLPCVQEKQLVVLAEGGAVRRLLLQTLCCV